MFPFSLVTLHWLHCFLLSRLKTEADISHNVKGIYIFSAPKNKDLFRGAGFLYAQYISKVTKLYFKHENAVQEKHILHLLPFKPKHDKTNKMTCAPSENSKSGWASTQYDQSLRCPHKEPLCSWLSIERTASEDSDQTGRMLRLIWVFAGRTG